MGNKQAVRDALAMDLAIRRKDTVTLAGTKIEKLHKDNGLSWIDDATALLDEIDHWKYLDPYQDAVDRVAKQSLKDSKYGSTIHKLKLMISTEVWQDFKHITDPYELWQAIVYKIKVRAVSQQSLILQKLEGSFYDHHVDSMEVHLNEVNRLVAQYKASGGEISNIAITGYLLRGLPDSYSAISAVANTDRTDTSKVEALLLGEEIRHREAANRARSSGTAYTVSGSSIPSGNNRGKGKGKGRKSSVICYYCDKPGHIKPECNKLKRDQEAGNVKNTFNKNKKSSRDSDSDSDSLHISKMVKRSSDITQEWYLDSGASDHITGNLNALKNVVSIKPFPMKLGDDSESTVTAKGSAKLRLATGTVLDLSEVLYCEGFGENSLISIRKLSCYGGYTTFFKNHCVHEDDDGIMFTGSYSKNTGLYHLDLRIRAPARAYRTSVKGGNDSLELMHRRFNHINYDYLIKSKDHTIGLEGINTSNKPHCDKCAIAKATQEPMRSTETPKEGVIRIDMWGPARVKSIYGNTYLLTCGDYAGGMDFIYGQTDRKSFLPNLVAYIAKRERTTGTPVTGIRLDNAPEFRGNKMQEWANKAGIALEFTTYYTPQQNGGAERVNRTIIEGVVAMLADSRAPLEFWEDAAQAFIYTRNRCFKRQIGKTAYEIWHGKKPDITELRVWFSVVIAKVPHESKDWHKLLPHGFKGVLLGYTGSGYAVYNPAARTVVSTNHCKIQEDSKGSDYLSAFWGYTRYPLNMPNAAQTAPQQISRANQEPVSSPVELREDLLDAYSSEDELVGDTIVVEVPNEVELEDLLPQEPAIQEPHERVVRVELEPEPEDIEAIQRPNYRPASPSFYGLGHSRGGRRGGRIERQSTPETPLRIQPRRNAKLASIGGELGQDSIAVESVKEPQPIQGVVHIPHTANLAFDGSVPNIAGAEPRTIEEAMAGPHKKEWLAAIESELKSLLANNTWNKVQRDKLPNDTNITGSRWVFKVKSDGRFKARLVAQGYTQREGVDYFETYAPVARFASIRFILALAALHGLHIHQMDVVTAFLNGLLDEDVYMEPPPGVTVGKERSNHVFKLRKALYGLKQSPRAWYQVIDRFMYDQGFERSLCDPAVYIQRAGVTKGVFPMIIAIYVDDLLIVGGHMTHINHFKKTLSKRFEMKDLGVAKTLLGIDIHRLKDGSIFINQEGYINGLLSRFGMTECKPAYTPMATTDITGGTPFDVNEYLQLGGSIAWPALGTRPDIAYAVGYLGRFNANPTTAHHHAQKRVLCYLAYTKSYGLLFHSKPQVDPIIVAYSDSDWAGDKTDRKSTSGNLVQVNGTATVWQSVKQATVADSTVVAEYISLAGMVKEALWVKQWLQEIGIKRDFILIRGDSQGAISFANNAQFSKRTKHVDIKHHFIRDHISKGEIELEYVGTEHMIADTLTKPLGREKFELFRNSLNVVSRPVGVGLPIE